MKKWWISGLKKQHLSYIFFSIINAINKNY